ncbi:MAG: hypothetical protein IPK99_08175 [Flavobacteriales bacterium]|nr:hypothetical protein [Flavobacteriales bacterium]
MVLGAIDRMRLLAVFGFTCTGIDDALMREMARDYGQGLFREPYMYGQNYNPMLEALVGAPFVRLFGHPWIVMPIVTSVLALIPYWSFALWWARRKEFAAATAFAQCPSFYLPNGASSPQKRGGSSMASRCWRSYLSPFLFATTGSGSSPPRW